VDVPWWGDMVNGLERPIVVKGFTNVPDGPGLGITSLNEEVIRQHLLEPGYFERLPSGTRERRTTGSGADGRWTTPTRDRRESMKRRELLAMARPEA